MEQNVGEKDKQILEKTEMMMLRRIKGVTMRDKVKSVDIRKELGVSSIREIRLRWYGHMQRMEENNEVRAIVDMMVPGRRPRGRARGRWIAFEGTCRNCGSPQRMPRTFSKSRIRVAHPWKRRRGRS